MEMSENSNLPKPSAVVIDSDIACGIPAIDEITRAKTERLDRHGVVDDLENPPSKRIKSSPSKDIESDGLDSSTNPEDGVGRRERQKGVAPIKAESVTLKIACW